MPKSDNFRLTSSQFVLEVLNGSSLRDLNFSKYEVNQNLIKNLVYGVLRHYWSLENLTSKLLKKPLRNKDKDVLLIIFVGLYELLNLNTKQFAVINECVNACQNLNKPWAKALVNACLRKAQKNLIEFKNLFDNNFNHPEWLIEKFKSAWPNDYKRIIKANNHQAPLTLRVNTHLICKNDFLQLLKDHNISYFLINELPELIILTHPIKHDLIPGFFEGYFYIQDAASQLAVILLDVLNFKNSKLNILDACAAPGGKTSYILQTLLSNNVDNFNLTAIDDNPKRSEKILENLKRLKLNTNVTLITGDAREVSSNNILFNKILLDAPCSALGVIRRHPDIKHHRKLSDLNALNKLQFELLSSLWKALEINGEILYSTCSILPEENDAIILKFLDALNQDKQGSYEILTFNQMPKLNDELRQSFKKGIYGFYVLPEAMGNFDGFYYCKIKKLN